jgi:hypothetical protein
MHNQLFNNMKVSGIILQTDKIKNEETQKLLNVGGILKLTLVIIMLSWITILPSCVVAVRTPRYDTNGVIIERRVHPRHHFRGEQHYRSDRNDHRQGKK